MGIIGTLVAAIVTQVVQGHHEQERQEQTRRLAVDDRWLMERQQLYAEYLAVMEPWVRWARTLRYSAGKVPRELIDPQLPSAASFTETAESLMARMELVGGQEVVSAARGFWLWAGTASMALAEANRSELNRGEFMRGVHDSYVECVTAMRVDLGVAPS
jgi:hypothetical protein